MNLFFKCFGFAMLPISALVGCKNQSSQIVEKKQPTLNSAQISIQEQKPEEAFSGSGRAFSLVNSDGKESDVIFGYLSDDEEPTIRINNAPYKVKHISSTVLSEGKGKNGIGRHEVEVWGNSQVTIELDYVTTSFDKNGTAYSGNLTVKLVGGKQASFKIRGGFGC